MGRKSSLWAIFAVAIVALLCLAGALYVIRTPTQGLQAVTIATPSSAAEAPPTIISSVAPELLSPPHDFVAQAMPTSFSIVCGDETVIPAQGLTTTYRKTVGSHYEAATNTKVIEYVLAIQGDTVALVQDEQAPWAAMPGSNADAVSVWGHADADPMVFNAIAQYVGDPSDCLATIVLRGGVLEYGFVQAHKITPKGDELNWSKGMSELEDRKGKLLVTTCFSADTEVSWEFALISSKAT